MTIKTKRLYQLHWQFTDGHTEMRAQAEIGSEDELRTWQREVADRHPLPIGALWMICNEKSRHFVMTSEEPYIDGACYDIEAKDD